MNCYACEQGGKIIPATRRLESGRGICSDCYEEYGSILVGPKPQVLIKTKSKEEKSIMPYRKNVNREEIVADFNSGMSNKEIAAKHAIGTATVSYHLVQAGIRRGGSREISTPRNPLVKSNSKTRSGKSVSNSHPAASVSNRSQSDPPRKDENRSRCGMVIIAIEDARWLLSEAMDLVKTAMGGFPE